jgi:predicted metal-dependent enzyme (double-stranded beta helix superfamily)
MSFDVDRFIEECKVAIRDANPQGAIRDLVTGVVAGHEDVARVLAPERAGVNTLYRSDDLTILNLVWGPEMRLLPHNHEMWAVIGIYGGKEENTFFRRDPKEGLQTLGVTEMAPGDCKLLGDTAIHGVYNPLLKLTGGLHVYGGDFFGTPRSEWDPESFEERVYDVERNVGLFEKSNERLEELKRMNAAD